jgi:hypothetical protein
MIELRADGKLFLIYGAKWITYATTREPRAGLPAWGAERLRFDSASAMVLKPSAAGDSSVRSSLYLLSRV